MSARTVPAGRSVTAGSCRIMHRAFVPLSTAVGRPSLTVIADALRVGEHLEDGLAGAW